MRTWLLGLALASVGTAAMAADQVTPPASPAAPAPAPARPVEAAKPGDLTMARVFGNPDLSGSQPRAVRLSPDGTLLTSLRNRADEKERFDLWAVDTASGQARMLVDSKTVGSGAELTEAEKMQRERARIGGQKGIVAYDWAPDGKSILVPLDGDLYLAGLDGKVKRLTNTPGGELNPVVSPKGSFVSFVRDQNVFVQPLSRWRRACGHDRRWRHGPFRRGGVRRAGGNGSPHRLLVVARRATCRSRAVRRGAGPYRHACVDRRHRAPRSTNSAIPPPVRRTCWSTCIS